MTNLIKTIKNLKKTEIKNIIDSKLKEFKSNKDWFSELCFCLTTANWKAKEAIELQKKLCENNFCSFNEKDLAKFLKKEGHRFWPQIAERIVLAKKYKNIKEILVKEKNPREFLVKNIKGLGYKESSHFLRNIGYFDYAILDRHILTLLSKEKIIEMPKSLTKKKYLEIEKTLEKLCEKLNLNQAELDLYLWYIKTGKILK